MTYSAWDVNGKPIKIDLNNDSEIQIEEALKVDKLFFTGTKISSLSGIENFTNLTALECSYNQLTVLDVSALINLVYLDCSNNLLTTLDLTGLNELTQLVCSTNQITNLNISSLTKLKSLMCANNLITDLHVSAFSNLEVLDFGSNQITTIDVNQLTNLKNLICSENKLTNLELSNITSLTILKCENNNILNLDIKSNLDLGELTCQDNQLTNLDVTGLKKLLILEFQNNKINSIDLRGLAKLQYLDLSNNDIAYVDLTGMSELTYISFFDNKIETIDFTGLPKLILISGGKNPIESIDISQLPNLEYVWLGYTLIHSLDLSNSKKLIGFNVSSCPNLESVNLKNGSAEDLSYFDSDLSEYFKTDCSNFSNCPKLKYICGDEEELDSISQKIAGYNYTDCIVGTYCSFNEGGANYTIQGNNRIDDNKNGCDASDLPVNIKFSLNDGIKTETIITNNSGNYSVKVKEGTYTLTPILENPDYFTISPSLVNVNFPTDASPYIQDFCITPIDTHNDLEITLIPLEVARPGFDAKYKLIYKNKGNQIQSGSVNLTFNDTLLDLVIANPVSSTQTANSLSWSFSNLKPFDTREITFTLNVNSPMEIPAVNNGDILKLTATIASQETDETPIDNTFTLNQTVVGSYDPNDKTCLEGSIITPNLIGEYVHYMIRFENTGTYAAQNIVVKDMIDLSKFDISTLIPTSSSHSFVTKISEGNKVEFIFENINLPFDDANNDGYVAFKIKTNPTLKVGDSFTNEANIYFDYNFPILTNKATSKFQNTLANPDFEFSNYFTLYPNPVSDVLNINSKQAIEIQSLAIYDILGQLVIAVPNAKSVSSIDVSKLRTGTYFLKVKSDKGSSSMKFIKN
nr:leucine-rich repeat domain-containing protein [uncultured Flavobacterium sp.]